MFYRMGETGWDSDRICTTYQSVYHFIRDSINQTLNRGWDMLGIGLPQSGPLDYGWTEVTVIYAAIIVREGLLLRQASGRDVRGYPRFRGPGM